MTQNILVLEKGRTEPLRDHFRYKEFDCKCDDPKCRTTLICNDMLDGLVRLRGALRLPLILNCAYRCGPHNKAVGGADHSQHLLGVAADIRVPVGLEMEPFRQAVVNAGFRGIGVYPQHGFIHADMRVTGAARWTG